MAAAKKCDNHSGAITGRFSGEILFYQPVDQLKVSKRQPFATEPRCGQLCAELAQQLANVMSRIIFRRIYVSMRYSISSWQPQSLH